MGEFIFIGLDKGTRITGVRKTFAVATQEAAKRQATVPVTLPTIGGQTYWRLAGLLHVGGIALPAQEH